MPTERLTVEHLAKRVEDMRSIVERHAKHPGCDCAVCVAAALLAEVRASRSSPVERGERPPGDRVFHALHEVQLAVKARKARTISVGEFERRVGNAILALAAPSRSEETGEARCGVETVTGVCDMPHGHEGEHDDRPLYPAPSSPQTTPAPEGTCAECGNVLPRAVKCVSCGAYNSAPRLSTEGAAAPGKGK